MGICGTDRSLHAAPTQIDELEAAGATVVRYEGADHGFVHDPARPTHRADDAADAWDRVLEFPHGRLGPDPIRRPGGSDVSGRESTGVADWS